jgi:hypothetical protein
MAVFLLGACVLEYDEEHVYYTLTSVAGRVYFRHVSQGPSDIQIAVFLAGACVLKCNEEDVYPTLPSVKRRIDFRLVLTLPVL